VLVTGASGFVGSWLVKALLAKRAHVIVLIRDLDHHSELVRSGAIEKVSVVHGSLEDFCSLERAINKFENYHGFSLGGPGNCRRRARNPLPTFEANIRGTYQTSWKRAGFIRRWSSELSWRRATKPMAIQLICLIVRHTHCVDGIRMMCPKAARNLIAASYYSTYGMAVAIARCGNIYGGGDLNWSRIVPGTIRSLLQRERPVLRSDGTYVRDYIYVEDAVSAYLALAECLYNPQVLGQALQLQQRVVCNGPPDRRCHC